jgi:Tfp pilus assembly protein FimT
LEPLEFLEKIAMVTRQNRAGAFGGRRAFTLLELLVVITIIIIMTTISILMLGMFLQGQRVKSGGRIVMAAFNKARQLAASERVWHFLVFDTNTTPQQLVIWRDNSRDFRLQYNVAWTPSQPANVDKPADGQDPIVLPDNVVFLTRSTNNALWNLSPMPHLAFRADGTIGTENQSPVPVDRSFVSGGTHSAHAQYQSSIADLTLEQTGAPGTLYIDYSFPTGKVIKMHYYKE